MLGRQLTRINGASVWIYSAPLLLILIAFIQVYRSRAYHQSPWKGGGFGMFASIEVRGTYLLRSYLINGTRSDRVATPTGLKKLETLVRTVPTEENLHTFAMSLARETWVPSGYRTQRLFGGTVSLSRPRALATRDPKPTTEDLIAFNGIRVVLLKEVFEAKTGRVGLVEVLQTSYMVES